MKKIGFGGGCHWCTEAVFQSLKGVEKVEQGWISSEEPNDNFSEAVIVHFNDAIKIKTLIEIHLLTHSSTKNHSLRNKYRSAIYYFDTADKLLINNLLIEISQINKTKYITQNLPFVSFKKNKESQLHYYQKNKGAPFCTTYINPKLKLLREKYSKHIISDF